MSYINTTGKSKDINNIVDKLNSFSMKQGIKSLITNEKIRFLDNMKKIASSKIEDIKNFDNYHMSLKKEGSNSDFDSFDLNNSESKIYMNKHTKFGNLVNSNNVLNNMKVSAENLYLKENNKMKSENNLSVKSQVEINKKTEINYFNPDKFDEIIYSSNDDLNNYSYNRKLSFILPFNKEDDSCSIKIIDKVFYKINKNTKVIEHLILNNNFEYLDFKGVYSESKDVEINFFSYNKKLHIVSVFLSDEILGPNIVKSDSSNGVNENREFNQYFDEYSSAEKNEDILIPLVLRFEYNAIGLIKLDHYNYSLNLENNQTNNNNSSDLQLNNRDSQKLSEYKLIKDLKKIKNTLKSSNSENRDELINTNYKPIVENDLINFFSWKVINQNIMVKDQTLDINIYLPNPIFENDLKFIQFDPNEFSIYKNINIENDENYKDFSEYLKQGQEKEFINKSYTLSKCSKTLSQSEVFAFKVSFNKYYSFCKFIEYSYIYIVFGVLLILAITGILYLIIAAFLSSR